eukprot:Phypoly_transcript_07977.p1 GENE.Phypoly_transcript_07977~~Phypoly_transcript_07977.p1  ORF type:complete len:515 (+),score=60.61 Phypoly_transcript_07977:219-1547(+)
MSAELLEVYYKSFMVFPDECSLHELGLRDQSEFSVYFGEVVQPWIVCGLKHAPPLHLWNPQIHSQFPKPVRDSVKTLLLVAKHKNWNIDGTTMHKIIGYICFGWLQKYPLRQKTAHDKEHHEQMQVPKYIFVLGFLALCNVTVFLAFFYQYGSKCLVENAQLQPTKQKLVSESNTFKVKYPYGYSINVANESIEFWRDTLPTWEPSTFIFFHTFIRGTTTYVGMGEWIGPTLLFAAQKAKRLIGAEPDPNAYKVLKKNIDFNPDISHKISTSKLCISDKAESVVMYGVGASGSFIGEIGKLPGQKDYKEKYSTYNWTSHCIPLCAFTDEYDAITDDMFIKLDTEGAEKIIIPSLYTWYSNFPFPHKPAMFISFHGIEGFEDKLESIVNVIQLYLYFARAGEVMTEKEIIFHTTNEFTIQTLIEEPWMDLFITDRPLQEFVSP